MQTRLPKMSQHRFSGMLVSAIVAGCLMAASPSGVAAQDDAGRDRFLGPEPQEFDDPQGVIDAFKAALDGDDKEAVVTLLGLDPEQALASDGFDERFETIREQAGNLVVIEEVAPGRLTLLFGRDLWPFPFPIVELEGKWAFDTLAGLEEAINRRVGENELQAIRTARNYVEAQEDYKSVDWDADGVLEYAQRLVSTPETFDGLYWPAADGVPLSPAGAFIEEGVAEDDDREGYFGYRYRILTGQGEGIAGGAYDYVINGNMIGGFGLIAWPVEYDTTGVNTFVVNHYGTVYEKDLGADTERLAAEIDLFDPDETWSVVTEVTH